YHIWKPRLTGFLSPGARPCSLVIRGPQGKRERLLIHIIAHPVGLAHLGAVIASVGQNNCFEHRNGLHFFIGLREAAGVQVKVARLLDQALYLPRCAAIGIGFPQVSYSLLEGLAILSGSFRLRPGLDHALGEQRKNEREMLFALSLPAKNTPCLLGLAPPLTMTVNQRRG